MIEILGLACFFLMLPAGLAWTATKCLGIRKAMVGSLTVAISAAGPALWVFYATQQADAITRAASVVVTPFLFLLMLIPAAAGYAIAKPKKPL